MRFITNPPNLQAWFVKTHKNPGAYYRYSSCQHHLLDLRVSLYTAWGTGVFMGFSLGPLGLLEELFLRFVN